MQFNILNDAKQKSAQEFSIFWITQTASNVVIFFLEHLMIIKQARFMVDFVNDMSLIMLL